MNSLRRAGIAMSAAALVCVVAGCSSAVVRESGAPRGAPVTLGKPSATTVVARGDNLYRIASSNGISVEDLAAWNAIPVPYTIHPGQRLRLYAPTGSSRAAMPAASRGRAGAATPGSGRRTTSQPRPAVSVPRATVPLPAPVNRGIAWRWPANGALINRYVAGEPTRQGVDIAGQGGAPVRAAGDGVVVYSGSGLVGYGELIILKHNEQWLSAYGHNRSRRVNEGQVVKAGEQIAELGRSGAPRDMLHFEVRYNGKPVDPLLYLPTR